MTENRRRLRRLRGQARRHIQALLIAQWDRCYWCPREIVSVRSLNRVGANHQVVGRGVVEWSLDGHHGVTAIATVDHKTPLSRGGDNEQSNLVAACLMCNQDRADKQRPLPRPTPYRLVLGLQRLNQLLASR